MAISDTIQTLSAAFSLGILLQAAITALLLYLKGHETKLSQDRRRLVLVVFLLSTALWAQLDFISLLIPTSKTSACQASTTVSTVLDQIARSVIGAYLLFSIGHGTKSAAEKYTWGGLVSIRVIAGVVFAIFIRPQFAPLCIARSNSTGVAVVPIALDTVIIGVLAIRILQLGLMHKVGPQERQEQNKALTFVTIGFLVWTATSVPMELGLSDIILLLRTAIPASGLTLLVGVLTIFPIALISSQEEDDVVSEAQSPFRADPPRSLGNAYNNSSDSGSPVVHIGYGKNGRLFVTNPSDTPRDSPTGPFQMVKGEDKSKEATVRITELKDGGESSRSGAAAVLGGTSAAAIAFGSGPSITSVPTPSAQQKKSLFGRSKVAARPNVRALGISQPILDESSAENPEVPFARMQTIDLATAAANERNRRENAAARLQNPRSAPMPPPPADEGLKRSTSTKRKEIPKPTHVPMPSISSSSADSIISSDISTNGADASSTSSSISPNREEVRRRSPRHPTLEEKQTYQMPQQLRQKLVVGLPSGPRSTIMPIQPQVVAPKAETVMLLNDIIYDNPNQVKSIMNFTELSPGGPIMKTKDLERDFRDSDTIPVEALPEYENTMSTIRSMDSQENQSIMERPRPYKKDRVKSRGLFPSDMSEESGLNRRRSKSVGSLAIRKSLLTSSPGSPTNLPALPPPPIPLPPTSAAKLSKLLSKSTLGMTADEKISMLFPAPPGVTTLSKRRSSVPSIPSMLIDDIRPMSPFGSPTPVIADRALLFAEAPESPVERRETYRFSANTYQRMTRLSEHNNEMLGRPFSTDTSSAHTSIMQNSPAYLAKEFPSKSISTASSTVQSVRNSDINELVAIPPPKLATAILRKPLNSEYEDEVPLSPEELDDDEVSVMIKSETTESDDGKESFLLDDEGSEDEEHEISTPTGEDDTPVAFKHFPWHRRIGDDLPTFSDRGDQSRPRAMPPPPPLLLNTTGRNAAVVVREVEPEPTDSPSRAIAEIQAQLKRFEETDRASVGALLRRFPADGSLSQAGPTAEDGRRELLENLEKEMGLQENAWMAMQHNFDRDSNASLFTPPAVSEEKAQPTLSREPSDASSKSFRSSSSVDRTSRLKRGSVSTRNQSPDLRDRASMWQHRLAQAQEEYIEKAPELQRKGSRNFLSIKSAVLQPSPIRLEVGRESEAAPSEQLNDEDIMHKTIPKIKTALWQPSPPTTKQRNGLMWAPLATAFERSTTPEPPALSLRPTQRRDLSSLSHGSSSLWMKPVHSGLSATRPIVGLWGSRTAQPKSIQTRPVTQRPPRKSKRITFLPDIVENPSPLPHKRDTLGLYQFPWGEKSDSAVYRPAVNAALTMAQPMFNPVLEARARELQSGEQSSSFFDEYDEEDFDNGNRDEDMDSDDDFDESTLWEIASLLKTQEGVPSKISLLPQAREVIDDYDDYEDNYDYDDEFENGPQYVEDRLQFEPAAPPLPRSSLWTGNDESNTEIKASGLAQPPTPVWKSYIPLSEDIARMKPKTELPLASLLSKQLWESEPLLPERHTFCLWNPPVLEREETPATIKIEVPTIAEEVVQYAPLPSTVFVQPAMWKRSKTLELEPESKGLFEPDHRRSVFRTTLASPVAKDVRTQRTSALNVPFLESTDLWTAPKVGEKHVSWIAKSAVDPIVVLPVAAASSTGTWTPPSKSQVANTTGLFTPGNIVSRTSENDPAAQGMTLKSRRTQARLPQLTSRRLWRSDNLIMIERDWISESSIRVTSPSIYSISSGATSPASDRSSLSSVASTSTKVSSVWSSMSAVSAAIFTTKPGRAIPKRKPAPKLPSMAEKKDEEEQKDQPQSKIPVRQNSQKLPTPAVRRESKVLANAAMFESRAQNEKSVGPLARSGSRGPAFAKKYVPPPSKPVYVPLRQQFRPIFIANWDAALQEAIAAGVPKNIQAKVNRKRVGSGLVRRKIPPTEWDVALELAIAAGMKKTVRPSMVRQRTSPAEWDSALATAISQGKPHFTGSKWTPVDWDMALRRAIAQGQPRIQRPKANKSMWSAALMQAIGPASIVTSHMWAPASPISAAPKSRSTWQAPVLSSPPKPTLFDAVKSETLRKARPSRIASLEKLTTTSFWRKEDRMKAVAKQWLHTSKSRPQATQTVTEVSREVIPGGLSAFMWGKSLESATNSSVAPMWSKSTRSEVMRGDLFRDVMGPALRKAKSSSAASLPKLSSKSFWQPSLNFKHVSRNWLQAATSSANLKTQSAQSNAENVPAKSRSNLWKSGDMTSEDVFADIKSEYYRKRTIIQSAKLPELHSTSFWEPTVSKPAQRNWLTISQSNTGTIAASAITGQALTWTAPRETIKNTSHEESMWSQPQTSSDKRSSIFSNANITTVRKTVTRKPSLPKLKSKQLFEPSNDDNLSDVHWLYVSSKTFHTPIPTIPSTPAGLDFSFAAQSIQKSPTWDEFVPSGTWTVPINIEMSSSDKSAMWTVPDFSSYEPRPSLFPELSAEPIKKAKASRPMVELPKLESKTFWQPATSEVAGEVNWIKASAKAVSVKTVAEKSPSATSSVASSLTWTPTTTSLSPATNGAMWDSSSPSVSNIFSNPHNEAWVRAKRAIEPMKPMETFELWRPTWGVESPKNWLVQKRASRIVQLKY